VAARPRLIAPWTTGELREADGRTTASAFLGAGLTLTLALVVSLAIAAFAISKPGNDLAGSLPVESVASVDPQDASIAPGDWPSYGRSPGGNNYSPLTQITPANVTQLTKAWTYNTGDIRGSGDSGETTYEVTPIKIADTVYLCTPHNIAIALDPVSGTEKWRFDPKVGRSVLRQHQTCRGVSYYRVPNATVGAPCSERIILPAADAKLYALDAANGQICPTFGQNGAVDLWANMPDHSEGAYYSTSPPAIARNLIIVGGAVNDNVSTSEPSGVIRAYNGETGQLVWNFDSGNPDRTQPIAPGETYTKNSPNSWSILSVDAELGLIYAPMGNAPPDQFGGDRSENTERFAASVTALDVDTGQVRWVFQTVHHDLWDMDVPAQPQLVTIGTGNSAVPGLVQATKQGEIFVLDRRTGTPILPVTEQPAPQGAAKGDRSAPTQPVSAISFNPPPLQGRDMWGATMFRTYGASAPEYGLYA
jgi:quinoprotein glucose dehydrogenase